MKKPILFYMRDIQMKDMKIGFLNVFIFLMKLEYLDILIKIGYLLFNLKDILIIIILLLIIILNSSNLNLIIIFLIKIKRLFVI